MHYFEEFQDDSHDISATQALSLISFGSRFSISSMIFWDFTLSKIKSEKVIEEMTSLQSIKVMNALQDLGLLTPSTTFSLSQKLISDFSSLTTEHIPVALIILNSEEISEVYSNT